MALPPDRLDRFARHIVLPEIGGAGQAALAKARSRWSALGGIGSPALQYLAAARDRHAHAGRRRHGRASNLQRQTIYREGDVGRPKAEARRSVGARVRRCHRRCGPGTARPVTAETAPGLIAGADLVLDGCDNFATRLAVSDACVAARIPLLSAAVGRFQGQVGAFAGHLPDQPCYRCFVGDAFDADDCDTCAEDGMLGAMAGLDRHVRRAARRSACCSRLTGGLGDPQWGKLHVLDGLAPSLRTMTIAKDPACRAAARLDRPGPISQVSLMPRSFRRGIARSIPEMRMNENGRGPAYKAGIALALLVPILTVWITVVHDDGTGMAWFSVIMVAAVGAWAAGRDSRRLARAMIGTSASQLLIGALVATDPAVDSLPGHAARAVVTAAGLSALWLAAGILLWIAGRNARAAR